MMEYAGIDVSESIDANKTAVLRECIVYHCYYCLMINFRFQPKLCDGCHDMTQRSICCNCYC